MPQEMPEVLDYKNLMRKLAAIDCEWEDLKNLLAFRSPQKNVEPAQSPDTQHKLPMCRDSKLVQFPHTASHPRAQTVLEEFCLNARLIKAEKQINRITLMGFLFMAIIIAVVAVQIFLK
jgi:hypothetical protein